MNICTSNKNATFDDSKITNSPALQIQFIMGCAMVITNIILVLGFTKKKQFTETTFIFLSTLGASDIIFGFLPMVKFIAIAMASNHTQIICRCIVGGTVLSAIMSSLCILLISIQVSIKQLQIFTCILLGLVYH